MAETKNTSNFFESSNTVLMHSAEQKERILDSLAAKQKKFLDDRIKAEQKAEADLARAQKTATEEQIAYAKAQYAKALQDREASERAYQKLRERLENDAVRIVQTRELNSYKSMSRAHKAEYMKRVKDELTSSKQALDQRKKDILTQLTFETNEKKKAALKAELKDVDKNKNIAEARLDKVNKLNIFKQGAAENARSNVRSGAEQHRENKAFRDDIFKSLLESSEQYTKQLQVLENVKKTGTKEDIKRAKEELKLIENKIKESEEYKSAEEEVHKTRSKLLKDSLNEAASGAVESVKKAGKKLLKNASDSIDGNLDIMFGSQGRMMGRLQGSAIDWAETVDEVSNTIGLSGIVSKKSVVSKMIELVDSGVAYNLEMRAFLAETSENIASTFSATNGTLLRLIRLQQADSTAARLGMEATLTELFNQYFEDTSYLAEDVSDQVSAALLDVSATMTKEGAAEFEWVAQKWLGSLYSLGMSSQTINTIAQGIGYLGTGNVSALSNNSALQTLLAMSAATSGGKSYDALLTTGLNAEETNKLLKSMVKYLADISNSQTNYVTKSAYADLFGMSITDLSTFASLTTEEIDSLYQNTMSYQQMRDETEEQLNQLSSRINISKLVDTSIENALVGVATNIGNSPFQYGTWKALSVLEEYVGEVPLPSVLAAGFGLSSDIDLLNVAKTGMVGLNLIGSLLEGLGSMRDGGVTQLARWNDQAFTKRGEGSGLRILDAGAYTGTSYSAAIGVGNVSASDVETVSLNTATENAYDAAGTSSEEIQEQQEVIDKIYNAVSDDSITVLSVLNEINEKLAPDRVFYTAISGVLARGSVSQELVNLSNSVSNIQTATTVSTNNEQIEGSSKTTSTQSAVGNLSSPDNISSLESIIAIAVETALRNVAGYSSGSGLPVTVTNMNGLGGL